MSSPPPDPEAIGSDGERVRDTSIDPSVEVFETHDLAEFEVARGLLAGAGIRTTTRGDAQARMLGTNLFAGMFRKPGFIRRSGALVLLVAERDADLARELLSSPPQFESVPELEEDDEP